MWEHEELQLSVKEQPVVHDRQNACLCVQPALLIQLRAAARRLDACGKVSEQAMQELFEQCMGLPAGTVRGSIANRAAWNEGFRLAAELYARGV